jgi:hypothetical protein
MLYREIIAVCSQIHTKHIDTLCGQNVVLNFAVYIVTTGLLLFSEEYRFQLKCNLTSSKNAFRWTSPLQQKLWR